LDRPGGGENKMLTEKELKVLVRDLVEEGLEEFKDSLREALEDVLDEIKVVPKK
jgi:hypothetical protein